MQLEFGMKKDPDGEIELLKVFWDRQCDFDGKDVTPTLLTYVDLLTTGDQRNIDTATIIHDAVPCSICRRRSIDCFSRYSNRWMLRQARLGFHILLSAQLPGT